MSVAISHLLYICTPALINMKNWLESILKVISVRFLLSVGSLLLAAYAFVSISSEIFIEKEDEIDVYVTALFNRYRSPAVISVMKALTFFGSSMFFLPAYIILVGGFLLAKKKTKAIEIAVTALSSTLILHLSKILFSRQRPSDSLIDKLKTYSFPSGHAMSSFVFSSLLIYLIWTSKMNLYWRIAISLLLLLFSFLVGISRVVLQVHYASDVIAGFSMGYLWVILSLWLQHKWFRSRKRRSEESEKPHPDKGPEQ